MNGWLAPRDTLVVEMHYSVTAVFWEQSRLLEQVCARRLVWSWSLFCITGQC